MIIDREDAKLFVFWMLLFIFLGWLIGWIHAHQTVATECKRLGKFYVGKTVWECQAITHSAEKPEVKP